MLKHVIRHAGPSKLPELGKVLGQTVKSFQGAAKVRFDLTIIDVALTPDGRGLQGRSVRDISYAPCRNLRRN